MNKIVDLSKVPTKSKKIINSIGKIMNKEKKDKKDGLDLRVFIKDLVDRKFKNNKEDEESSEE